jgi:cytochrome c oxidase cbb3-type subunit 1
MDSAILSLLGAFLLSIIGLFVFIWSLRKGLLVENPRAASAILRAARSAISTTRPWVTPASNASRPRPRPGDSGHLPDEHEIEDRIAADRSSAFPVFMFIAFACMWLLFGGIAGLTASLKLHWPDWLVSEAWMTFGRMRGAPDGGALRLDHQRRAGHHHLAHAAPAAPAADRRMWVMMGAALINVGIASAIGAIGSGWTDGMEYLEIPGRSASSRAGLVCIIGPVLYTLVNRKVESLYVSVWYHTAGLLWISLLFIVGKLPACTSACSRPRPTGGTATTCWACGSRRSAWAPSTTSCPRSSRGPSLVQPVHPGLLDAGLLLRPGRRPPPGGRAGAGLADHAVHRAEHDDDHPGLAFSINMA